MLQRGQQFLANVSFLEILTSRQVWGLISIILYHQLLEEEKLIDQLFSQQKRMLSTLNVLINTLVIITLMKRQKQMPLCIFQSAYKHKVA